MAIVLDSDSLCSGNRGWSGTFTPTTADFQNGLNAVDGPYRLVPEGASYCEARFWLSQVGTEWVMLRAPTLNSSTAIYDNEARPAVLVRSQGLVVAYEGTTGINLLDLGHTVDSPTKSVTLGLHWYNGGYAVYIERQIIASRSYNWTSTGTVPGYIRWVSDVYVCHANDFVVATGPPPWTSTSGQRGRRGLRR